MGFISTGGRADALPVTVEEEQVIIREVIQVPLSIREEFHQESKYEFRGYLISDDGRRFVGVTAEPGALFVVSVKLSRRRLSISLRRRGRPPQRRGCTLVFARPGKRK